MIEIRTWLKEADPLASEPALSFADIERMRRAVLSESAAPHAAWRPRPVLVGATIALTLTAGVALGRRLPAPSGGAVRDGRTADQVNETALPAPADRRQLQFATRGGTRIIWIFNSDFTL